MVVLERHDRVPALTSREEKMLLLKEFNSLCSPSVTSEVKILRIYLRQKMRQRLASWVGKDSGGPGPESGKVGQAHKRQRAKDEAALKVIFVV